MSEHAHEKQTFRNLNEGLDQVDEIDDKKTQFKSKYDQQIAEMRKNGKVRRVSDASKSSGQMQFKGGDLQASGLAIENDRLQTTILLLNQKLNEHCDHEQQIDILKEKNVQMEEQIQNQNAAMLNKDKTINQLSSKIKQMNSEIDKINKAKEVHKHDNCDLNEKATDLEEELYESKQITLDLLEQLKDLELKYQQLEDKFRPLNEQYQESQFQVRLCQSKIAELHDLLTAQNRVYIAKKYDDIDNVLGNYINRFPEKDKMKIMFIRHSEGVYQFGQKKVGIKIEAGNSLQVRVGGGYMHIDDFIDQYTPGEIEKIERNGGVNKRFQRKYQMQTIASKSGYAVESSPVRRAYSPSPNKLKGKSSYTFVGGRTNTLENVSPNRKFKKSVIRKSRPQTWGQDLIN